MNSIINALLSNDQVITTKQTRNTTFDIARGFAVLFMIMTHVVSTFSHPTLENSWFVKTTDFLGGPPAAPVFVLLMGVFFVMNQRDILHKNILRGSKLFILGIILSYFRDEFLYLFSGQLKLNTTFWEVDILQFAGLAYILMSVIYHYFKKPIVWLILSFVILVVSPLLWGITSKHAIFNWLFHLLWGTDELTYFPIFAWLFYPLIGMVLGVIIKNTHNSSSVIKHLLKPGLICLVLGSIISLSNMTFHIGDYFRSGPGAVIWILGFVFIWLWLLQKLAMNKLTLLIAGWGKRTTAIYIIHWLLISWSTLILGYEAYGHLAVVFIMILIITISHYASKYIKIKI